MRMEDSSVQRTAVASRPSGMGCLKICSICNMHSFHNTLLLHHTAHLAACDHGAAVVLPADADPTGFSLTWTSSAGAGRLLKSLSRKASGQFCSLARRLLKSPSWLAAPGASAAGAADGCARLPEAASAATKSGIGMGCPAGILPGSLPSLSAGAATCDMCIRMVSHDRT